MSLFDPEPETLADVQKKWKACKRCFFATNWRDKAIGACVPEQRNGDILIVGQAPGAEDMENGIPFSGKQGLVARRMIRDAGFDDQDLVFTNVLLCLCPFKPTAEFYKNCRDQLEETIQVVDPLLIVALGSIAATRFGIKDSIATASGKLYRYKARPVVPVIHPAAIARAKDRDSEMELTARVSAHLRQSFYISTRIRQET